MPKLTTSQMAKMTIAGITGVMPTGEQSGICVINSQQILMKVGQSLDLIPRGNPPQGIYEKITEDFPDVGVSWFYDESRNGSSRLLTELTGPEPSWISGTFTLNICCHNPLFVFKTIIIVV